MVRSTASWRVFAVTVWPQFLILVEAPLHERVHRIVGIVTAPGPRARRTNGSLGVAQRAHLGRQIAVIRYGVRRLHDASC